MAGPQEASVLSTLRPAAKGQPLAYGGEVMTREARLDFAAASIEGEGARVLVEPPSAGRLAVSCKLPTCILRLPDPPAGAGPKGEALTLSLTVAHAETAQEGGGQAFDVEGKPTAASRGYNIVARVAPGEVWSFFWSAAGGWQALRLGGGLAAGLLGASPFLTAALGTATASGASVAGAEFSTTSAFGEWQPLAPLAWVQEGASGAAAGRLAVGTGAEADRLRALSGASVLVRARLDWNLTDGADDRRAVRLALVRRAADGTEAERTVGLGALTAGDLGPVEGGAAVEAGPVALAAGEWLEVVPESARYAGTGAGRLTGGAASVVDVQAHLVSSSGEDLSPLLADIRRLQDASAAAVSLGRALPLARSDGTAAWALAFPLRDSARGGAVSLLVPEGAARNLLPLLADDRGAGLFAFEAAPAGEAKRLRLERLASDGSQAGAATREIVDWQGEEVGGGLVRITGQTAAEATPGEAESGPFPAEVAGAPEGAGFHAVLLGAARGAPGADGRDAEQILIGRVLTAGASGAGSAEFTAVNGAVREMAMGLREDEFDALRPFLTGPETTTRFFSARAPTGEARRVLLARQGRAGRVFSLSRLQAEPFGAHVSLDLTFEAAGPAVPDALSAPGAVSVSLLPAAAPERRLAPPGGEELDVAVRGGAGSTHDLAWEPLVRLEALRERTDGTGRGWATRFVLVPASLGAPGRRKQAVLARNELRMLLSKEDAATLWERNDERPNLNPPVDGATMRPGLLTEFRLTHDGFLGDIGSRPFTEVVFTDAGAGEMTLTLTWPLALGVDAFGGAGSWSEGTLRVEFLPGHAAAAAEAARSAALAADLWTWRRWVGNSFDETFDLVAREAMLFLRGGGGGGGGKMDGVDGKKVFFYPVSSDPSIYMQANGGGGGKAGLSGTSAEASIEWSDIPAEWRMVGDTADNLGGGDGGGGGGGGGGHDGTNRSGDGADGALGVFAYRSSDGTAKTQSVRLRTFGSGNGAGGAGEQDGLPGQNGAPPEARLGWR